MSSLFHVDIFVCITELDTVMPVVTAGRRGVEIILPVNVFLYVCVRVCVHARICLSVY